jgi:hypothetical protein
MQVPSVLDIPDEIKPITYKGLEDDQDLNPLETNFPEPILGQEAFIEDIRVNGGKNCLKRIEQFGRTERGTPIVLRDWYAASIRCLGDWRLPYVAVTGAAQVGKTLGLMLVFADMLVIGRLPVAYCYANRTALDKFVSVQQRPLISAFTKAIESEHGITIKRRSDKNTNDPLTVNGVTYNFSFASTSKETAESEGKSIIANTGASYMAAALGQDERSRWPHGADFSARLGNSPIPSKPKRDCGTKGGGGGIEVFVDKCDRIFTQHYTCNHCGVTAPLDPYGCLLTKIEIADPYGRKTRSFLSNDGRPHDWWVKPGTPLTPENAIIACSKCGEPLSFEQRVLNPHMRCKVTGIELNEYLDNLPQNFKCTEKVALDYSPLCRENSHNLASQLIDEGLTCENPRVWQQETLGVTSTGKANRLTLDILRPLIGADHPADTFAPWRTIAGLDCGRKQHWLWIQEIYLPFGWEKMKWVQVRSTAIRRVLYGGKIHVDQIEDFLERYKVDFGLIDNEPERTWAAGLCDRTCLEMADQVPGYKNLKIEIVESGGEAFNCWKVSNPIYKQAVLNACLAPAYDKSPSYRFPADWEKWTSTPTEDSPLRHFMGPSFDPVKEQWNRPADSIDDIFMSAFFAEAAFEIAFDRGPDSFEVEW